jgi:ribosomal protein S18 acetylase RimI-like enzyme
VTAASERVPTIGLLARHETRTAAAMLGRAFDDSPLFCHLIPRERPRASILRAFFVATIRDALPFGAVFASRDGERVTGVAVWLPPGRHPPGPARLLRQLASTLKLGPLAPRSLGPSLRYLRATEAVHPQESHWYLAALGVDPAHQGRGLGGRLLDQVLADVDAEAMPAYLETDKERNLAFYARYRFELVDTLHPDGEDAPPTWTMWRAPTG